MHDFSEHLGTPADLRFLQHDAWLTESTVSSRICKRAGRWHLWLVFADTRNPLCLLVRYIDHYPSRTKAEVCSNYFLKSARRDERGHFTLEIDAFHICNN
ncbi:MAG TPA: hypothetical protein PLW66_03495 [Saprospiraceae bacterium]|nr:hypothetical protein [Saprospiraceae bacterium]HNL38110.1 hypothetical protein [Saprospiraceae bacterium]